MHILAVGINHHTAPVELRERFAIPSNRVIEALGQLRSSPAVQEAVLLSTCNRVEVYAAGTQPDLMAATLGSFFQRRCGHPLVFGKEFYLLKPPESIRHLFDVSAALDSMVVGETEILGQVKDAYRVAHEAKQTGPYLNRLFQNAFAAAKDVRTNTTIGAGQVSIGSVAAELARQVFGDLRKCAVLLVGAGEISETTARALRSRGAHSLIISNRSHDRAVALVKQLGGETARLEELYATCQKVDIVITSTAAPQPIITRENLEPIVKARAGRPLFLIDIAVPRNIERSANQIEGVHLFDIDDLEVIADRNLAKREKKVVLGREIIQKHVATFTEWMTLRPAMIAANQR
jgi:glutamyl-tRNA reductase